MAVALGRKPPAPMLLNDGEQHIRLINLSRRWRTRRLVPSLPAHQRNITHHASTSPNEAAREIRADA